MTEVKWQREGTTGRQAYDGGELGTWTIEPWGEAGQVILKHSSERHQWNGGGTIHKTWDRAREYVNNIVKDHENPTPRRGSYTLDDFAPFVEGKKPLPNEQGVQLEEGVNDIAARGHMFTPRWGYWQPFTGANREWAQYFLQVSDGSGYAMIYGANNKPKISRFAICLHQKKTHPGANHSRGWHPGHCIKCGLDLTVDSGD